MNGSDRAKRLGRFLGLLLAALFVAGAFTACGGAPYYPDNGTCNPGREWVSPYQDDNGDWHTGYCRAIE